MAINSGFRDTIRDIIYPRDHCTWDHLGNGSGSYFTTTSIGGVSLANTGGIANGGCARFENNNAGYWRVNYTDALRLSNRTAWTIDFWINILTDSTSTTNFQTSNEGVIIAAGETGKLDGTSPAVDYAITINSANKLKFYYHDGTTLNVITSTATIYNNQFNNIKILYDEENIEIYIRETLDSSTAFSGNIRNSSGNFVIGGNSSGNYLYSALIDTFSIRRDISYSFNQIDGTLATTPFEQLIEPTNSKSGWDIETLLRFSFNEGAGNAPKPRQLKLIPQTWGNWNYWFVNPKSSIDITTSEINFDQTITGFKDVDVRTTDGFLCMYGLNDTTDWQLNFSTNVHGQDGDINFNNQYPDLNLAIVQNFTTTDFNIRIPTRGYLPLEQRTESQTLLDTTKIDSVSANAKYNQGMRPRGLKKIQYKINENSMSEKLLARSTASDRFFIGLPYYEVTTGGNIYENGWWLTDKSISYADTDFRFYANSNIKHISSITKDSANAIIVTTADAHGLTTGNKIMVRPGLVYWSTLSSQLNSHDFYNNVSGIAYVQTIDSTSVKLFVDSTMTNVKDYSDTLPSTQYGYIVTVATDTAEPTLIDDGIKKIDWTKPFSDIISVTSTANVVDYIDKTTQNDYTNVLNSGLNTYRNAEERSSFDTTFVKSNPTASSTYTVFNIPAGSATDPFITTVKSGGFTGTTTVCTYVLEGDVVGNGNLKFYVDNAETPDSTTHGIYYRLNRLNGYYEAGVDDDSITYSSGSVGTTYTLPITGESYMGERHLRNFILFVALASVPHAASGDRSKARITVWFESSDGKNDRIFYAGGWQPGRTTRESFVKPAASSSTNPQLFRKRSYVVYETNNENVDIEIKGVPEIGYTALGQTYISPDYSQSTMQISGQANHYDFYTVDETLAKSSGGVSTEDIAPWIDEATQTAGQYRLFEGVRYLCRVSHRSSFKFWDDYSLGYWDKV